MNSPELGTEQAPLSTRVLEIGMGSSPAVERGGKLFEQSNLEYVGIDLPGTMSFWHRERTASRYPNIDAAEANAAAMPFRSEVFDVIFIRSVFGQFTGPSLAELENVIQFGMMEAYRVLKPGAEIVIVEENTPWDARYVEHYLCGVGFLPETFEYM